MQKRQASEPFSLLCEPRAGLHAELIPFSDLLNTDIYRLHITRGHIITN